MINAHNNLYQESPHWCISRQPHLFWGFFVCFVFKKWNNFCGASYKKQCCPRQLYFTEALTPNHSQTLVDLWMLLLKLISTSYQVSDNAYKYPKLGDLIHSKFLRKEWVCWYKRNAEVKDSWGFWILFSF